MTGFHDAEHVEASSLLSFNRVNDRDPSTSSGRQRTEYRSPQGLIHLPSPISLTTWTRFIES